MTTKRPLRPFGAQVLLPRWLWRILPPTMRYPLLTAAAIIGSRTPGRKVKLGQVSVYDSPTSQNTTLHFSSEEIAQLESFAFQAHLSSMSSTLRTAIFIALRIPGSRIGIIKHGRPKDVPRRLPITFCRNLMQKAGVSPPRDDTSLSASLHRHGYQPNTVTEKRNRTRHLHQIEKEHRQWLEAHPEVSSAYRGFPPSLIASAAAMR